MALTDRQMCVYMKNELKRNPIGVLSQFQLTVGLAAGHQTTVQNLSFAANNANGNQMRIGSPVFCSTVVNMADVAPVRCLATPMRTYNDAHRQDALLRFGTGVHNAEFWVTVRQTGCSVAILDWGGGQYSMVHLSPYHRNQINAFHHYFYPLRSRRGSKKRASWLRDELTTVVEASRQTRRGFLNRVIHIDPLRYILVQSSVANYVGDRVQIIGVNQNAQWVFYLQTAHNNVLNARELAWHDWNWYSPYQPAIL